VIGDKTIAFSLPNLKTQIPEKTLHKICYAVERELERHSPTLETEPTAAIPFAAPHNHTLADYMPPPVVNNTAPVPEFAKEDVNNTADSNTLSIISPPTVTPTTPNVAPELPLIKHQVDGRDYGADKQGVVHFLGDLDTLEQRIANRNKVFAQRREKLNAQATTAPADVEKAADDTELRVKFGRTVYSHIQTNFQGDIPTFTQHLNETLDQLSVPEVKPSHVESWVFGESYPQQNQYDAIEKTLLARLNVSDAEKEALSAQLRAAYTTSVTAIDAQGAGNLRDQLSFGRMLTQLRQKADLANDEAFANLLNETPRLVRDGGIPKEGFTPEQVENLIFGEHPITAGVVSVLTRALHDTHGKLHEIYQGLNSQQSERLQHQPASDIQR
jgi:hypothetical protein